MLLMYLSDKHSTPLAEQAMMSLDSNRYLMVGKMNSYSLGERCKRKYRASMKLAYIHQIAMYYNQKTRTANTSYILIKKNLDSSVL